MLDLLITQASLPDGRRNMSVAVQDGKIVEVTEGPIPGAQATEVVDAQGYLLSPPFVDPHFHMDATLSYGLPRVNESGTLLEGMRCGANSNPADGRRHHRARPDLLRLGRGQGPAGHPQPCGHQRPQPAARRGPAGGEEARGQLHRPATGRLSRKTVCCARGAPGGLDNLKRALDMGVDVVGGIPHFERTMAQGAESVKLLCELAAERGKLVDMHCDESDDPLSRHIETLAYETQRLGLQGRVTGSHCTSMHSMDNYYVSKLLPLMAEAA
jgi:cytosine deaminase